MDLLTRAAQLGVETSFVDAIGQHRSVDPPALQLILDSIPDALSYGLLTGPSVCRSNEPPRVEISGGATLPVSWRVLNERGVAIAEGISTEARLSLPCPPQGVYSLRIADAAGVETGTSLLSVPDKAFSGEFERVWILAVQLYGIRSSRNWGIGDFTDLESLIEWASQSGAAGVGLNPLHVLFDDHPQDCSPYSPNSRLFLNPLYIDVSRLPELSDEFVVEQGRSIEDARSTEFVDYVQVASLKLKALRRAFATFKSGTTPKRRASFDEFRRERGGLLFRFACFEMLRRKFACPWWDWPDKWSCPNDVALEDLRCGPDALDIEFVEFVQWCADQQLKSCSNLANQLKLPIGLYLDVAVGVKADGFDAWNEQVAISRRLSVGAPPDQLNTAGQDWGLAGFNSTGLQVRLFEPFREMLRASMRYAGAIRLDHVLGLNRLYVVPAGYLPNQGTYVQMPFEALLGVASLESLTHRCIVIGEDLGTVPDGFRDRLADWGIWSYRVMIFERDHDGSFYPVERYPHNSMVTFSTHDLPTYSSWQSGHDIDLKQSLRINPGESRAARAEAFRMLAHALNGAQLSDTTFYSALAYLSRTRSRLLSVSIEDLLGVVDQPNIPGTIDEHPNWRRRLPFALERWSEHIDGTRLRSAIGNRSSS